MGVDNTGKMGKGLVEALRELASGRGDGVKSGEGELRVRVDGGESREDGKTPRDEMRNERNWRTWRTEGILGGKIGAEICEAEKGNREGGGKLGTAGEVKLGKKKLWSAGELRGDQKWGRHRRGVTALHCNCTWPLLSPAVSMALVSPSERE